MDTSSEKLSNGSSSHTKDKGVEKFAKRAQIFLMSLPGKIEKEVRSNPYRAVGIAVAVGFGGGMVLGSRILRAAVMSAASFAAIEIARKYASSQINQHFDNARN